MLFSEVFELTLSGNEEWFDPILSIDTKLFVDPFLIFDNEAGVFKGAHSELIGFFNEVFKEVAKSGGNRQSGAWTNATNWLLFPEVEEVCLGVSSGDTDGRGSSHYIARQIASAIWKSISRGRAGLDHWEEVQLFEENIARDRISDATLGILREKFCRYTNRVCQRLEIPMKEVGFERYRFDVADRRWKAGRIDLPLNKQNDKAIILVPKKYLRGEPSISSKGFWEYCYDHEAEILRKEFGDDITRRVDKKTILELADKHPELSSEYARHVEKQGSEPYDLKRDEATRYQWYDRTRRWVEKHKLHSSFENKNDFLKFVNSAIDEYSNFVTNNAGWKLLWNDNGRPKAEEAAQVTLLGIVSHYCKANDVDISKEVNIGRGPVDFKVASGYSSRILIELKLAKNSKFWHGLEKQLPKYLEAEQVDRGIFVVVCYSEKDIKKIKDIQARVAALAKKIDYKISVRIVDARKSPPSASKIK